jgi:hydroxyethylthiazole kinase
MAEAQTKGVDSTISSDLVADAARQLSQAHGCVVCISGATDYIVEGDKVIKISNGHPLMPRVTGLGCTASALCGAFAAVNDSPLAATAHAMAVMGIAGELAGQKSAGPGSLQVNLLDALFNLTEENISKQLKVEG